MTELNNKSLSHTPIHTDTHDHQFARTKDRSKNRFCRTDSSSSSWSLLLVFRGTSLHFPEKHVPSLLGFLHQFLKDMTFALRELNSRLIV